MNKSILISGAVAAIVSLGLLAVFSGTPVVNVLPAEVTVLPVETRSGQPIGAFPGSDFGESVSIGGSQFYGAKRTFEQLATTTLCAVDAPSGSTTLHSFTFKARATTTAYTVKLFKSDNISGTGTQVMSLDVAAGAPGVAALWGSGAATSSSPNFPNGVFLSSVASTSGAGNTNVAYRDRLEVKIIGNAAASSADWKLRDGSCNIALQEL
jgi:hypothetical protein